MRRFGALVILSIVGLVGSASAETITLNPSRDNTLFEHPTGSLSAGQGAGIFAGRASSQAVGQQLRRGVIYFDLSAIPAGATIDLATLRMVSNGPGLNGARNVSLHRLLADWGEGASTGGGGAGGGGGGPAMQNDATWLYRFYNAADPASSPAWDTPGGSFVTTASTFTGVANAPGPAIWRGLEPDIRTWLADPSSNFGWVIIGDESTTETTKRFASREAINIADRPALTILYRVPEPGSLGLIGAGVAIVLRRRR